MDPTAAELVSAAQSGDAAFLEQLIYARPFGFENIRNNPASYSLDVSGLFQILSGKESCTVHE